MHLVRAHCFTRVKTFLNTFYLVSGQSYVVYKTVNPSDVSHSCFIVFFHFRLGCKECVKDGCFLLVRIIRLFIVFNWGYLFDGKKTFVNIKDITSFHQFCVPKFPAEDACRSISFINYIILFFFLSDFMC